MAEECWPLEKDLCQLWELQSTEVCPLERGRLKSGSLSCVGTVCESAEEQDDGN